LSWLVMAPKVYIRMHRMRMKLLSNEGRVRAVGRWSHDNIIWLHPTKRRGKWGVVSQRHTKKHKKVLFHLLPLAWFCFFCRSLQQEAWGTERVICQYASAI